MSNRETETETKIKWDSNNGVKTTETIETGTTA